MIKFVVIFSSFITLNFFVLNADIEYKDLNESVIELAFSEPSKGMVGGEPVYPVGTNVKVINKSIFSKKMDVFVNDKAGISNQEGELDLKELAEGHYTIIIKSLGNDQKELTTTYGFTLQ